MKYLIILVFILTFNFKSYAFAVVDLLNRQIYISNKAERIVAVGPGTLRLVCYMGLQSKVVGIENIEKKSNAPYIVANQSLLKLPIIGQGGPNYNINIEEILKLKPDIIFASYLDRKAADVLQQKTHIPVVVLSYGQMATFDNQDFKKSLMIIGQICKREDRSKQIIDFLGSQFKVLENLKDNNAMVDAYIGGLGMRGAHGIESTQGNFLPFKLLGINNVASKTKVSGAFMINKEELLKLNPQYIFIDFSGIALVKQDYKKKPLFYRSLNAFKVGQVYIEWPYNYYATNIDNALIDTYWIAKIVYKKNIDIKRKANDIYSFLLGKPLYDIMSKYYKPLGKVEF